MKHSVSLRHLGRKCHTVVSKQGSVLSTPDHDLLDTSGGPLLESLSNFSPDIDYSQVFITHSGGFETQLRSTVESEICQRAKVQNGNVIWSNSGSDCVESAVWAAAALIQSKHGSTISNYVVRKGSYHGNTTLGRFLSTRGNDNVEKENLSVIDESQVDLLAGLKQNFESGEISQTSCVVLETFPTTGYQFSYSVEYLKTLFSWLNSNNIPYILDEVACGVYRHDYFTSRDLADEINPVALCVSKGLTNGWYPISACFLNDEIAEILREQNKRPLSFTYGFNDMAALFIQQTLNQYDSEMASENWAQRKALIANTHDNGQLGDIHCEFSTTGLRLRCSQTQLKKLNEHLLDKGLMGYSSQVTFCAGATGFFMFSPAIDMPVAQVKSTLEALKQAVAEI